MDSTNTTYKLKNRQRPEALALLIMTMTLTVPANTASSAFSRSSGQSTGQFDASSKESVIGAMKLEIVEKRKRRLKKQISKNIGNQLSGRLFLLPYETADFLATLGIEPDHISSTEDNGILLEFHFKNNYHSIEFFPDGEVVLLQEMEGVTKTYGQKTWGDSYQNYTNKLHTIIA